jgi:NAD(P)-dependent dehydrogenase (short-subunit alcohol dehydrogenase family)
MANILITGAGRGLGLAMVKQALASDHQVFATVRSRTDNDKLRELESIHGERLQVLTLEASDPASIHRAAFLLERQTPGLDLLINNAGINSRSGDAGEIAANFELGKLQAQAVLHILQVNAVAPILIAQEFLKLLKNGKQPKIINISSWFGSISEKKDGGNYSYCSSKAALNMMTRCLAFDVLKHGIVAVAVNPGWVQTDMGGQHASLRPEESASAIFKLAEKINAEDAGNFFDWNGSLHPW